MIGKNAIETVSGKFVDLANIDPATVDLNDAAWAISRISRFAGHTITAIPFNVAQHSCYVAQMIVDNEKRDDLYEVALFGLLHDCGESLIGDIPSPVKHLPGIKDEIDRIEDRLLWIFFDKYVGKQPTDEQWALVKKYDWKVCRLEAYQCMPSRGLSWLGVESEEPLNLIELQSFPAPVPAIEAYKQFVSAFNFLKSRLNSTT